MRLFAGVTSESQRPAPQKYMCSQRRVSLPPISGTPLLTVMLFTGFTGFTKLNLLQYASKMLLPKNYSNIYNFAVMKVVVHT